MYVKDEHLEPIPHVLPVAPLLPAREGVVEALRPVLDLLYEPLDQVLLLGRIDGMLQSKPPARLIIPSGLVRQYGLPPVPPPHVLEEEVADHQCPLSR